MDNEIEFMFFAAIEVSLISSLLLYLTRKNKESNTLLVLFSINVFAVITGFIVGETLKGYDVLFAYLGILVVCGINILSNIIIGIIRVYRSSTLNHIS